MLAQAQVPYIFESPAVSSKPLRLISLSALRIRSLASFVSGMRGRLALRDKEGKQGRDRAAVSSSVSSTQCTAETAPVNTCYYVWRGAKEALASRSDERLISRQCPPNPPHCSIPASSIAAITSTNSASCPRPASTSSTSTRPLTRTKGVANVSGGY